MLLSLLLALGLVCQDPASPLASARTTVAAAEQLHGAEGIEVAEALLKLFPLLVAAGLDDEALAAAQRALAIREAKLPPGHQRIGIALTNVATMYVRRHDLEQAIPLLERSRDLLAKTPPSRAMLGTLSNLGLCQCRLGDYAKSLATLEAAAVYGRQHAPDHPMLGSVLQNMAQVHLNRGDIERARALVAETLALFEKAAPGSPGHAHALYGLGFVLLNAGRSEDAEPLLLAARAAYAKLSPGRPLEVGRVEAAIGWRFHSHQQNGAAVECMRRALAAAVECKEPSSEAVWRGQLAMILEAGGNPAEALQESTRAMALPLSADKANGSREVTHGSMLAANGRYAEAVPCLRRGLDAAAAMGVEYGASLHLARGRLAYSLHAIGEVAAAIAVTEKNLVDFPALLERTLPALSESDRLGMVASRRLDLDRLLEWSGSNPELCPPERAWQHTLVWKGQIARGLLLVQNTARQDHDQVARLRRLQQIANEMAMGAGSTELRRECDALRAAVGKAVPGSAVDAAPAAVCAAVAADAVLLDFVSWRIGAAAQLSVFVVRREGVQRIDYGPAAPIQKAVDAHVQLAARSLRKGAAAVAAPVAAAAREQVLKPLLGAIGAARRLWISPDDVIATLPFETLPGAREGTFLFEQCEIAYVQNSADLLRPPLAVAQPTLLAFGDIDYGGAPIAAVTLRGVPRPFAPLPATAREVADVVAAARGVTSTVVRGGDATEARLRDAVGGATFVHLATHGFWGLETGKGVVAAGIALAHANDAPEGGDGILTVDEAMFLDLGRCRLIVLSACQTGLGKPFAGESLLGLRRALRIAGARATVTSLWRVDDTATAALMADFYRALFASGADPGAALRTAQLRALALARQQSGEGLPGLWGAFVYEGTR